MTKPSYPGVCWPNKIQNELLVLALLEKEAVIIWRESWQSRSFSDLDRAGQRLLPLIWHNLQKLDISGDELHIAHTLFRKTWYQNQLLLRCITGVLERMQRAGITPMVVKGGALILTTYDSPALRPMTDFDVLVRTEDVGKAIEILKPDWISTSEEMAPEVLKYKHSLGFRLRDSAFEFDLHWHLLPECLRAGDDDVYWQRAGRAKLPTGSEILTLSPTDQLFHVCVHGVKNNWGEVAPLWWIADAAWLLKKHPIDWDQLLDHAVKQRLVLPLRYALHYLYDELKLDIPVAVLESFRAQPVTVQEERELAAKTAPFNYYRRMHIHWYQFRREEVAVSWLTVLPRFLRYLQARWGVQGAWETVTFIARTWLGRKRARAH